MYTLNSIITSYIIFYNIIQVSTYDNTLNLQYVIITIIFYNIIQVPLPIIIP